MTEEELRDIEARADAATPGPWNYYWNGAYGHVRSRPVDASAIYVHDGRATPGVCGASSATILSNLEFVSGARADVPALIAEVRFLQAQNERLRTANAALRELDESRAELGHENARLRELVEQQRRDCARLRALLPADGAAAILHDWRERA